MKKIFLIIIFTVIVCLNVFSVPADPHPKTIIQPNGKTLTFYIKGDEHIHWCETLDGYTVLNGKDGVLEFACKDENGNLLPSGIIACNEDERSFEEEDFLSQTPKKLFFSEWQIQKMREK